MSNFMIQLQALSDGHTLLVRGSVSHSCTIGPKSTLIAIEILH